LEAIAASGLTPLDYMLSVMRDEKVEAHRRDEMAKAAAPYVHPRIAPAQPGHPDPDFVPLHIRIREYARQAAIHGSNGKVVDTGQSQKERVGLQPVHRHRQDLDENDPAFRSKTPDDAEGIKAKQAPPRAPDWRYADDDDGNWMTV
jgi:hypothetical protein